MDLDDIPSKVNGPLVHCTLLVPYFFNATAAAFQLRSRLDEIIKSRFWIKIITNVSWILCICVKISLNPSLFG
jgi:hypothetical protein